MDEDQFAKETRKFEKWRDRTSKSMPDAARRAFALRGKSYPGYGFHYDMEKKLGWCLWKLNDLDDSDLFVGSRRSVIANRITLRIIVQELFKSIAEAERSLKA